VDKRDKVMEDFKFFFHRLVDVPEGGTEVEKSDIPLILATASNLVMANEIRKLESVVHHGIKDILDQRRKAQRV